MLKLENIYASYHEGNPILRGINMEVGGGELKVILGRNGAGKTTLANTIFGAVPHIRGKIIFKDKEVLNLPQHRVNKLGIGYFKQGAPVFPQMSVGENLLFVSGRRRMSEIRPRILELTDNIDLFQNTGVLRQAASSLSGGERTQLVVAMTLFNHPDFLILDEPFAGLSPANAGKILAVLHAFHASSGAGMILIAQDRQIAASFSKSHFFLRDGLLCND
jgi:ABC-type branched-subunit amino acid transport system ATPase component